MPSSTNLAISNHDEKLNFATRAFRHVTYWLAADNYDNHDGTKMNDIFMATHTQINRLTAIPLTIATTLGGGSISYLLSFGTSPLATTIGAGLAYGTAFYGAERYLANDLRIENGYEAIGSKQKGPFAKGLTTGVRIALALINAGIISTATATIMLKQEIDFQLFNLDQEQNAELFEVFETTTDSARARSIALTAEIEELQQGMARQETFLGQLISGDFDPEASPEVMNLRDQVTAVESDIANLQSEKEALELSIRGKQGDIRQYTDIIQAEALGNSLTVTLSTGETVTTSNAGIAGCGSSCEALQAQQANLRIEIANDQSQVGGYSESIVEQQDVRTGLLSAIGDIIANNDGEAARQRLIGETQSTIDAMGVRVAQKTAERTGQLAIIDLAYDEMQADPTYQDPGSPSNIISAASTVKDDRPTAVAAYLGTVSAGMFLLELFAFIMLKNSGASPVSVRRARKEIETKAEDIKLGKIANAVMRGDKIEEDRQNAFQKELSVVLKKDKNLNVSDRNTIMDAMKQMLDGTLDADGLQKVSDLIEDRKTAIAEQPKWHNVRKKKTPQPSAA